MSASRRPSWLPNAVTLAVSVVLTLAGLEGAARLARSAGGGRERDERSAYMEPDPYLGWKKRPNARVSYRRREYTVEVSINSKGLRDRERGYQAAPGTFRMLALGDSFIEAYSVSFERCVTAVIERLLGSERCPVEVINGGTTGYSTDQEYLFYHQEGGRYSPDVVVLFFHYNDLLYNVSDRYYGLPKPLLAVTEKGLELANFPVPSPPPAPHAVPRPPAFPRGSAAWQWLKQRLMTGAPRAFNVLAAVGLWEPLGGDTVAGEMRAFKRRPPADMLRGWRMTDQILSNLAREVEARGGRFLVAYVPARMEVIDRDWELTRLRFEMRSDRWDRRAVVQRLERSGQGGGFPVLDLTDALRREEGLFHGTYYARDGHWNERGHRAAAAELARFLRDQGWLPACLQAR